MAWLNFGNIEELTTVKTELGLVATLICSDSWHPHLYEHLKKQKVDIISVPSFLTPAYVWNVKWGGYTTDAKYRPNDVDFNDIGKEMEKDMWIKYSLQGRMKAAGCLIGISSFAHGQIWELACGGQSSIIVGESVQRSEVHENKEHVFLQRIDVLSYALNK